MCFEFDLAWVALVRYELSWTVADLVFWCLVWFVLVCCFDVLKCWIWFDVDIVFEFEFELICYEFVLLGLAWFCSIWADVAWFYLTWFDLIWFLFCFETVWFWFGLISFDLVLMLICVFSLMLIRTDMTWCGVMCDLIWVDFDFEIGFMFDVLWFDLRWLLLWLRFGSIWFGVQLVWSDFGFIYVEIDWYLVSIWVWVDLACSNLLWYCVDFFWCLVLVLRLIWLDLFLFGLVCFDVVRSDLVWFDLIWFDVGVGLNWF